MIKLFIKRHFLISNLPLTGPYTRTSTAQVLLSNRSSDQWIAFKVQTLDRQRYEVNLINGKIAPGAQTTIELKLKPLSTEAAVSDFLGTKQKFLIQWRPLIGYQSRLESAVDLVSIIAHCALHKIVNSNSSFL